MSHGMPPLTILWMSHSTMILWMPYLTMSCLMIMTLIMTTRAWTNLMMRFQTVTSTNLRMMWKFTTLYIPSWTVRVCPSCLRICLTVSLQAHHVTSMVLIYHPIHHLLSTTHAVAGPGGPAQTWEVDGGVELVGIAYKWLATNYG